MMARIAIAVCGALLAAGCQSSGPLGSIPDLSGTYDTATITPLQRPEIYGDKLTLSAQEAQAIAAEAAARIAENSADSDPNREAPPEGGDGNEALGAGSVGGYNLFWIDPGEEATDIDGEFRTSIIVSPANGRRPPLTPAGRAWQASRRALYRPNTGKAWWVSETDLPHGPYDGPETLSLAERCLLGFGSTAGPPMLPVLYNNHKRIVQTQDHVLILAEMIHDARVVRLNAEHRPASMRFWLGDSVGRWEGDTLVVETTNFSAQSALRGADENLKVTERFQRQPDGSLLYRFTVEDPTIWTQSWSGEYAWKPTTEKVFEYACHEGNYSMEGILKGARQLEADAYQAGEPNPGGASE